MTSQILAKHTRFLRLNKDKLYMTKSEEVVRTYNIGKWQKYQPVLIKDMFVVMKWLIRMKFQCIQYSNVL
jgi:hypothetical protein